jgi:hypothetical protein
MGRFSSASSDLAAASSIMPAGEWACLEVDFEIDSYYRTITAASNVIPKRLIAHEALG